MSLRIEGNIVFKPVGIIPLNGTDLRVIQLESGKGYQNCEFIEEGGEKFESDGTIDLEAGRERKRLKNPLVIVPDNATVVVKIPGAKDITIEDHGRRSRPMYHAGGKHFHHLEEFDSALTFPIGKTPRAKIWHITAQR